MVCCQPPSIQRWTPTLPGTRMSPSWSSTPIVATTKVARISAPSGTSGVHFTSSGIIRFSSAFGIMPPFYPHKPSVASAIAAMSSDLSSDTAVIARTPPYGSGSSVPSGLRS